MKVLSERCAIFACTSSVLHSLSYQSNWIGITELLTRFSLFDFMLLRVRYCRHRHCRRRGRRCHHCRCRRDISAPKEIKITLKSYVQPIGTAIATPRPAAAAATAIENLRAPYKFISVNSSITISLTRSISFLLSVSLQHSVNHFISRYFLPSMAVCMFRCIDNILKLKCSSNSFFGSERNAFVSMDSGSQCSLFSAGVHRIRVYVLSIH